MKTLHNELKQLFNQVHGYIPSLHQLRKFFKDLRTTNKKSVQQHIEKLQKVIITKSIKSKLENDYHGSLITVEHSVIGTEFKVFSDRKVVAKLEYSAIRNLIVLKENHYNRTMTVREYLG